MVLAEFRGEIVPINKRYSIGLREIITFYRTSIEERQPYGRKTNTKKLQGSRAITQNRKVGVLSQGKLLDRPGSVDAIIYIPIRCLNKPKGRCTRND